MLLKNSGFWDKVRIRKKDWLQKSQDSERKIIILKKTESCEEKSELGKKCLLWKSQNFDKSQISLKKNLNSEKNLYILGKSHNFCLKCRILTNQQIVKYAHPVCLYSLQTVWAVRQSFLSYYALPPSLLPYFLPSSFFCPFIFISLLIFLTIRVI